MIVRIVTVPALENAFDKLEIIKKMIVDKVYPVLKETEGWIKSDFLYNNQTKKFKAITYWSSAEHANVIDEKEPDLTKFMYTQISKFAEYFDSSEIEVEIYELFESIAKEFVQNTRNNRKN